MPPEGGPLCCKSKNGKVRKLAALKHRPFFFHFLPCSKGIDTWELRKSKTTATATSTRPLVILLGACQLLVLLPLPPSPQRLIQTQLRLQSRQATLCQLVLSLEAAALGVEQDQQVVGASAVADF